MKDFINEVLCQKENKMPEIEDKSNAKTITVL